MLVRDLMTKDVATCRPFQSLNDAAHLMWKHNCGCLPILDDDGRVLAMLTDRDVCMAAYTQGRPLAAMNVASAMSKTLATCADDDAIDTAEAIMREQQVRRLPVVDREGKLVGVLSLNDIATHGRLDKKKVHVARDGLSAAAIAGTLSAICARSAAVADAE